jgi:hypothetical protein
MYINNLDCFASERAPPFFLVGLVGLVGGRKHNVPETIDGHREGRVVDKVLRHFIGVIRLVVLFHHNEAAVVPPGQDLQKKGERKSA